MRLLDRIAINMADEYNPDIVSVVDDDGKEYMFEELDRIETDTGHYVALLPMFDEPEKMLEDDGDIIILKAEEENGEIYLSQIEDEEEFQQIGQIFDERLAELFSDEEEDED
ncbi:MAG: DUF1292 domain-containing protein [Clostridiales bacterium]|nr:DUF1292 domain-containing protein [Clostridiales bacterium]